jgi:hypothetical protein
LDECINECANVIDKCDVMECDDKALGVSKINYQYKDEDTDKSFKFKGT